MKNSPLIKCKKKRKSGSQIKKIIEKALIDYNQIRNAFPKACKLQPRKPSSIKNAFSHLNYKFKVTRSVRRNILAIKRTIITNEGTGHLQNTNRISINDRIGRSGGSVTGGKFDLRCSSEFLEGRVFKMANSLETSTNSDSRDSFPKVTITFEQMLSIRKKRLHKKHHKSVDCVEVVHIEDESLDVIEIKDDSNIINDDNEKCAQIKYEEKIQLIETNHNENIIEIKDDTNVALDSQNNDIIDSDNQKLDEKHLIAGFNNNNNNMEITGENITSVIVNSEKCTDGIDLASCAINDAVIDTSIIEIPLQENSNKMSNEDLINQSVVIVENNSVQPQTNTKQGILTRWSSTNSVVLVSDTSSICQDVNDSDIIFVSEECSALANQRKLDCNPVVIIDEDHNNKFTHNRKRNRSKSKRRLKKKKRNCNVSPVQPSSKSASCADVNCNNSPNRNQTAILQNSQLCSSQVACSMPSRLAIPETSATVVPNIFSRSPNNKFGSNIYNTGYVVREGLRQIIIDGSNIALGHSNGTAFSVKGLQIAIDYFIKKGHKVKAFVPQYRLKFSQSTNPALLRKLIDDRLVVLTPSREIKGRRITPYDDRYIIQYATTCEGIVVSNDNFRDLLDEKPEWRHTIERRLLMYTWIDDILIFPEDPLGRHGPNLTRFLKFP